GTNSIIKIGKDGLTAAETTDSVAVVGDKVQLFADNFGVKADNQFIVETDEITMKPYTATEAPTIKLWSNNVSSNPGVESLPAELVLERNSGAGFAFETLGKIVGKGQPDPAGETPQEFASILFKSPHVVDDGDGLQGAIYFKTLNSGLDQYGDEIINLMDINGTKKKQVTIKGDLKVGGAISMNGAAFTAPITSDARGAQTIGTQGVGEWKALHLWDDGGMARITFGSGTDAIPVAGDIQLEHDPATASLTLSGTGTNDPHRLQFRDNTTYIHSSGASILDIVAPTLNIDSETAFTSATSTVDATTGALKVTGGISTQENLYVGGTATVNGVFTVGAGGDEFSITESSDDITIDNSANDKDIIFTVNKNTVTDTEILRLVGAEGSLKMATTQPLQFYTSTNSISGSTENSLTIASPNIRLNASGAADTSVVITNSETTVNNELELQDSLMFAGGSDEFVIKPVGALGDYGIKNLTQDKDIIIKTNSGGTDTEVARVVGATASLQMDEEQKLEFKQASNYINATDAGATLNLVAGGELAMNAATMTLQGTDDLLTITKNLASEELTSATQKNPVLTISNTAADAFGGILELKKA
ncbi:MAG: hypothetical protein QF535_19095, partial [Anaerolineales bacterium]|nr:hypothetical protein [Anaerolineales bacterium]